MCCCADSAVIASGLHIKVTVDWVNPDERYRSPNELRNVARRYVIRGGLESVKWRTEKLYPCISFVISSSDLSF